MEGLRLGVKPDQGVGALSGVSADGSNLEAMVRAGLVCYGAREDDEDAARRATDASAALRACMASPAVAAAAAEHEWARGLFFGE